MNKSYLAKVFIVLLMMSLISSISFAATWYRNSYSQPFSYYLTHQAACDDTFSRWSEGEADKGHCGIDYYVDSPEANPHCIITYNAYCTSTRFSYNPLIYNWTCDAPLVFDTVTTSCVASSEPPPPAPYISGDDYVDAPPKDPNGSCDSGAGTYSPSASTGHPINTTNGNKSRVEKDFNASGLSPLKFTRFYNSNKNKSSTVGVNWRHSYTASLIANIHTVEAPHDSSNSSFSSIYSTEQLACESGWNEIKGTLSRTALTNSTAVYLNNTCQIQDAYALPLGSITLRDDSQGGLSLNPPQDSIVIERANGNIIKFTLVNSVWTAPSNTDVSLEQTATGYTLTTAQDTVEEYNLTGQLISTTSRTGIQQILAYNQTTGLLETVTDSFGQSLIFAYTGTKLTSVTLPDNSELVYGYDAENNFSTVKREDNSVKTYFYEDARFPNALTGITNGNNERHMTFTYDALGRAITSELAGGADKVNVDYIDADTSTVTDALGQIRTYRFTTINGKKLLTDIEGAPCGSCGGKATHTTYDANGYVASSTDFNGNVTTFVNNLRGLPISRTEATGTPAERVTTTSWHSTYPLPVKITQADNITDLTYDEKGNLLTRTQIDTNNNKSRTWTYTYNAYGQVLSVDGARTNVNDITTYAYDVKGNIVSVTNALGHVTQITAYDMRNQPLTLVDSNGLVTQLTYDVRGWLLTRTVTGDGNSLTTTFSYDAVGNLTSINLPDGKLLNYGYDAAHRLISISDQVGNSITYTLDALGNRLKEDSFDPGNALVRTRTRVFNVLSQLTQSIGAQNQTTSYGYDANGNRLTTTDAANSTTTSAFDALNRVISITDPLNGDTTYGYDNQGNLASVTDANGITTTYTYNGIGDRTSQTSPETGLTAYSYDTAGNVLSQTDAKGQTTTYQYDVLNRLTQTTYADNTIVSYVYDQGVKQSGRLTGVNTNSTTNGLSSLTYVYDVYGRLLNKTQTVNTISLTTTYSYDTQGRMSSMRYPSGSVVSYSYRNGQLSGLTVNGQSLLNNINYEVFSSVKSWIWGNGTVHSRGYDLDGQLISQSLASDTRTLGYDTKGNITSINDTQVNQVFGYDALNRLTAANDATFNQTMSYDANGNRLSFTEETTSDNYNYDAISNQLLSISGNVAKTYQYDANGNIISDGENTFNYGSRNRLINVNYPQDCPAGEEAICGTSTDDATYQINALGQRIVKQANNKGPDYVLLNSHYQQAADEARLQASGYTEQANSLLAQALNNETQAQALNQQAVADRAEAQSLNQQADLIETEQQSVQTIANELYASVADYQALIIEPATSFIQSILNSLYQAIVDLLTVIADAVQIYADNLAQQVTDLRLQADTLIANATTAEQQAITLLATATQNKLDAINLQTLAAEQTVIADASQVKADNYLALSVTQPKHIIETRFVYNERGQLIGEYNATGNVKQEIIYLGNQPVGVMMNNVVNYIHTDHLGTPRIITDTNNTTIWSWHSDPFGKTAANEDPDGDGNKFTFNLRFAGQYYDAETGLHYNYFRDYDPSTGRYVQSDPIGLDGGLNTYGYVGGNPLSYTDQLGLAQGDETTIYFPSPVYIPPSVTPDGTDINYVWDIPGFDAASGINSGLLCLMFKMCSDEWVPPEEDTGPDPMDDGYGQDKPKSCDNPKPDKKNCQAVKDSMLNTCASLTGMTQFRCWAAANKTYRKCMGYE